MSPAVPLAPGSGCGVGGCLAEFLSGEAPRACQLGCGPSPAGSCDGGHTAAGMRAGERAVRAPQEAASASSPGFNSAWPCWPCRLVNLSSFLSLECEAAGANLREPCRWRATWGQVAFGFCWSLPSCLQSPTWPPRSAGCSHLHGLWSWGLCQTLLLFLSALSGRGRVTPGEPGAGDVPLQSALSHLSLLTFAQLMPKGKSSGDTCGWVGLTWVNLVWNTRICRAFLVLFGLVLFPFFWENLVHAGVFQTFTSAVPSCNTVVQKRSTVLGWACFLALLM